MKPLTCAQCQELWDELIHESTFTAGSLESAEVKAHLQECMECQTAFQLLQAASFELRQSPLQKAPATLRADILRQIEKQPSPVSTWLTSLGTFFHSPGRLAWAASALTAVFLIALLMRPDQKTTLLPPSSTPTSNREQIQQNAASNHQPSIATAPKTAPKTAPLAPSDTADNTANKANDSTIAQKTQPTTTEQTQQKTLRASPKASVSNDLPKPARASSPKMASTPQPTPQKPAAATAPSADAKKDIQETTDASPSSTKGTVPTKKPAIMKRALPKADEAQGYAASASSKHPAIIHWSKTITAKKDVAQATISITLKHGLQLIGIPETKNTPLWKGALHRGQQVSVKADLRLTGDDAGILMLDITNSKTQKVLLHQEITIDTGR